MIMLWLQKCYLFHSKPMSVFNFSPTCEFVVILSETVLSGKCPLVVVCAFNSDRYFENGSECCLATGSVLACLGALLC